MSNSQLKMVAFDIDGVLNEHGGNILPESVQAIELLRSRGLQVCFASGKHAWYIQGGLVWSGILDETTLIVAENGGVVYNPATRRTLLEEKYLPDVARLRSIFRNLRSTYDGFLKFDGMIVWEEPKETLFCLYPKNVADLPKLEKSLRTIVDINDLHLSVVRNPDSIDVLQQDISKATGLAHLCSWQGIEMSEIIAFGDSTNDIEMIRAVGYPVTVHNGLDSIKSLVRERGGYIAKQRSGHGVLEAVNQLIADKII